MKLHDIKEPHANSKYARIIKALSVPSPDMRGLENLFLDVIYNDCTGLLGRNAEIRVSYGNEDADENTIGFEAIDDFRVHFMDKNDLLVLVNGNKALLMQDVPLYGSCHP